jgi:hypothetical protein
MKTVAVKGLFEGIVRLLGLDPGTASLTAREKAEIAELVNDRVADAYRAEWWPDLMTVEQRRWRPTYDAAVTYATEEEVFFTGGDGSEKYYRSLVDGNLGHEPDPDGDTAYWHVILADDDFEAYIEFEQDGETEIGDVDVEACLFNEDPRLYPRLSALGPTVIENGKIVLLAGAVPTQPWVRFRPVAPEFSWTDWSSGTEYAVGDLVYVATYGATTVGQTFKAIASSTNKNPYTETGYWEPVDFPDKFRTYVKHAVRGDKETEAEGRGRWMARAEEEMERLRDELVQARGLRRAEFRR